MIKDRRVKKELSLTGLGPENSVIPIYWRVIHRTLWDLLSRLTTEDTTGHAPEKLA